MARTARLLQARASGKHGANTNYTSTVKGHNMTQYSEQQLPTDNELNESLNAFGYGLDLSGYGNQY